MDEATPVVGDEDTGLYQIYPSEYCGLDRLCRTPVKLFIGHVLEMKEHPSAPGVFLYKNHCVTRVQIQGIIVSVDEKNRFYNYGVDDGTGVIGCCCWKSCPQLEDTDYKGDPLYQFLEAPFLASRRQNAVVMQGFQLGDVINVKGKINLFRGNKGITSSHSQYYKVCSFQEEMCWMLELPRLYRAHYDCSLTLPDMIAEELKSQKYGKGGCFKSLEAAVMVILESENQVSEEQLHVHPDVTRMLDQSKPSNERSDIVSVCLAKLCQQGTIYKTGGFTSTKYKLTIGCGDLQNAVLQILDVARNKPKYEDTGCHYCYILEELHMTFQYNKVTQNALKHVLDILVDRSQVISISDTHYIAYS